MGGGDEDALCVSKKKTLDGTLPENEYVGINRRVGVFDLGQSQHICGVVIPLSTSPIQHLPDFHGLIFQILNTVDGVCLHIPALLPDSYICNIQSNFSNMHANRWSERKRSIGIGILLLGILTDGLIVIYEGKCLPIREHYATVSIPPAFPQVVTEGGSSPSRKLHGKQKNLPPQAEQSNLTAVPVPVAPIGEPSGGSLAEGRRGG